MTSLLNVGERAVPAAFARSTATHDRVIDAAVDLTSRVGWSKVTMSKLADEVGVSRQTVYNEVGTKPGLAEAMILRELQRFMALVQVSFDGHVEDLEGAIRAASETVLEHAQDNTLLKAVVSATHGADTELLPLLTTHSESLLSVAKQVIADRVTPYRLELTGVRLDAAIDAVVRLVLSHIMQPTDTPARTADNIAWIAAQVLARD